MKIFLFGCGAIGSNVITNLVMDYKEGEYIIIDKDKVEARNIQAGTQFYFREQLGKLKTQALRMNIYNFFGKRVGYRDKEIKKGIVDILEGNVDFSETLFIDAFDNAEGRNLLKRDCDKLKIDCVHIGFSPQYTFEVTWNENYENQDDKNQGIDICEMSGARAFVLTVSGLASQIILDFLKNSKKINLIGNKFTTKIL